MRSRSIFFFGGGVKIGAVLQKGIECTELTLIDSPLCEYLAIFTAILGEALGVSKGDVTQSSR